MAHEDDVDISLLDQEQLSGMKTRHCTDIPCLLLFVAFCGGMGYCMDIAFKTGDIRRLSHGFNYKGQLCGVDKGAENRPLLYFCPNGPNVPNMTPAIPSSVDLAHPICVSSCPASDAQEYNCYMGSSIAETPTARPNDDFTVTIKYDFKSTAGYPTYTFMHRYCIPKAENLAKQVIDSVCSGTVSQMMVKLGSLRSGYPGLVVSGGLAVLLGYSYLLSLRIFAGVLVYACLLTVIFGCFGAGGYLIYAGLNDGVSSACGDARADLVVGGSLAFLGLIFVLLTWCQNRSIRMAIACVQAACECMFAMPTLLLQPLLELIGKIAALAFLMWGFLWVVSTGDVTADTAMIGGQKVGGLSRTFVWTDEQKYMMLYWGFGMFWIMNIFSALGQFVVSYAVTLWYYSPKDEDGNKDAPNCPLCRGAFNGVLYHFGTLAFGGFLVAICQVLRVALGYLAKQAQGTGNAVMATIAKALVCCVTCFQRFLEFINKNAYMDVAINSTSFCAAAKNAFDTITSEISTIAILNGACFIFQIAGGCVISGVGAFLTYTIVTTQDMFTSNDSTWFVADPVFLAAASGVVCMTIAWAFMIIFDQTADTLLYCFITDKNAPVTVSGRRVEFAPRGLQNLISESK